MCVAGVQSHPGGQLFYDSLYGQYADWGVDFIKNDCVVRIQNHTHNTTQRTIINCLLT